MTAKLTLILLLLLGVTSLLPNRAEAHALDQSYVFLRIYDDSVQGRFEATVRDLNRALGLNLPEDRDATKAELTPHIGRIQQYFRDHVDLGLAGEPRNYKWTDYDSYHIEIAQYVVLNWELEGEVKDPRLIDIDYRALFDTDRNHRGLLVIEHNWKTATFKNEADVSLIFDPSSTKQQLDLESSSFMSGFIGLIKLGIHHIWIGIDHILFLFALLLPAVVRRENGRWTLVDSFKDAFIQVLKVVTIFTIAHSITLSLAALGIVSFPSRVVESIIAVSIAIAAIDILVPVFKGKIGWIVLAFGLFHGFGFASVLGEIGISSKNMAWALLGFNIGVEIGQAVIVILGFPILFLLARTPLYTRAILPVGAVALVAVSLYWFTERAFELDLPAGKMFHSVMGMFS